MFTEFSMPTLSQGTQQSMDPNPPTSREIHDEQIMETNTTTSCNIYEKQVMEPKPSISHDIKGELEHTIITKYRCRY